METIKNGVPKGSILGPLLFVIYVNDLPHSINKFASAVIYADDTRVLVSAKNLNDLQTKIDSTLHHIWMVFIQWINLKYGKDKYDKILH